ncbi:unnamed protein product [marine sediment metagenome]|uniref:Uncharacterized protein n=1 Tax=marine sediment metagenome TaxID=412755 RepID=X0V4J6_9ZZZZ
MWSTFYNTNKYADIFFGRDTGSEILASISITEYEDGKIRLKIIHTPKVELFIERKRVEPIKEEA